MKKVIVISGKEYTIKSSAYTQFKYRDMTGRRMLTDLQNLTKLTKDDVIDDIDELSEIILKITYIMIEEADPNQVKSYEDFLKGIENLYEKAEWMGEVVEVATSPFSRGL